ncbi:MAG TPA: hypothetical protein VFS97_02305 [Nitrososphaeraceae archaeon]|nr:hypothetical protein [Nitrososphaeraceae archaeon]
MMLDGSNGGKSGVDRRGGEVEEKDYDKLLEGDPRLVHPNHRILHISKRREKLTSA